MKKNLLQYALGVAFIFILTIFSILPRSAHRQSTSVKLVLLIVADQFPYRYLDQFGSTLYGGIGKLLKEGTLYREARFDYAVTNTCPGHATITTGELPRNHGIIDNWWFDRTSRKELYCVGNSSEPASPRLLEADSIADSIKQIYGNSKAFTVSGKDRAAVILGGKQADAAWWFNQKEGGFTSSSYYLSETPKWVEAYNTQHALEGFGSLWQSPQLSDSEREQLQIKSLKRQKLDAIFPYSLGGFSLSPQRSFFEAVFFSPLVDAMTNRFTQSLLVNEQLGQHNGPDFLGISFSALDTVGHRYGPNSEEVYDTLQKLDYELGTLFEFIDAKIGLENTLVVFTSDHGIQSFPEFHKGHKRISSREIACIQEAGTTLVNHFGPVLSSSLYFDHTFIRENHISMDALKDKLRELITECDVVAEIVFSDELHNASTESKTLWTNSFFSERSPDFYLNVKDTISISYPSGTGHGSPYDFDRHVPVIFMGKGFNAKTIDSPYAITQIKPDILHQLSTQQ